MRRFVVPFVLLAVTCDRGATSTAQTPTPALPPTAAAPVSATTPPVEASPPTVEQLPPLPVAGELHYHEVMLGGAEPADRVPMIIAIHGLGDDPRNFAGLFEAFPERARLVLPQAVDPTEGGGWSWFPIRARSGDAEGLAQGIRSAADKIAASAEVLVAAKPTVGRPLVTGFSQGGMLTFALAVEHPDVMEAGVAVGGWLPPPLWPESLPGDRYPSLLALHGTADGAVHFEPTAEAVAHLQKLGFPIELRPYEGVQHVITPQMRQDLFDRLVDGIAKLQPPAED